MRHAVLLAAGAGLALAGCTAGIGGGVVILGLTVSALAMSCDDPIRATVWDQVTAHAVCDATVTAVDADGTSVGFSPCYASYLGEGTWTVTATKPGHHPAKTTVIVSDEKGCHPAIHTVELTLVPLGAAVPAPLAPATAAPPPAAPVAAPVPAPEAAPVPAPEAAPAPASATVPAPASTTAPAPAPEAAPPRPTATSPAPAPTAVPAPATR